LGTTLEKEGKKYSAAQAFTAVVLHYPGTIYASKAKHELKKLHQPVDTEEDPLRLVLTESGFGDTDQVKVRQGDETALASADSNAYPPLPILNAPPSPPASPNAAASGSTASTDGPPAAGARSSISSGAAAASASTEAASTAAAGTAGAMKTATRIGPATLNRIRLSSANPPMSVIFDLTGPVAFDNQLQDGSGSSTLTIHLKETKPATGLATHMVFDRSIFHDCDIQTDAGGTTVTVNTSPVSRFAVIPLNAPSRLLVTFTPEHQQPAGASESSGDIANSID
ncbi:MAG: tetratricopeptide repeat protein, partial [Candidatus Binataceae bacterium]